MESVKISGLKELQINLGKFGSILQREADRKMTQTMSATIARKARDYCPVGETRMVNGKIHEGGTLKKTIKSVRYLSKANKFILYKVGFQKTKKYDPWYAHIVEYGSAPHVIPSRIGKSNVFRVQRPDGSHYFYRGPKTLPGFTGRRFFTRAFEDSYKKAITNGANSLKRSLKKYRKIGN